MTALEIGQHSIFSVDAASGRVRLLVRDGYNDGVDAIDHGVAFTRATLTAPADLWIYQNGHERRLTELNADRLMGVRLGAPEQFTFTGAKGDTVYAYLVHPVDFDPSRKYPLAFLVHGGPQGSMGNEFHYRWNPQTYAGAGYAAVLIDFHGSTGYGAAFQDAINHDWGGAPYEDLMKGLDASLARYPWIDGGKVCALGASFGGYMINYLAGKTDRFKCLVTHDGNIDERMAYFDTEELWFPEWEHGGTPWDNPEEYAKHNPIEAREELEDADARRARRQGLPDRRHAGHLGLHGAAAQGDPVQAAVLPRREPLGAQPRQQHPLARHGERLAGQVAEGRGLSRQKASASRASPVTMQAMRRSLSACSRARQSRWLCLRAWVGPAWLRNTARRARDGTFFR